MVFLNINQIHQLMKTKKKEISQRHYKINKNVIFYYFLLVVINIIDKMQKAVSNKIQLGETLNCLDDYGGVPSINDEGTLENLMEKLIRCAVL